MPKRYIPLFLVLGTALIFIVFGLVKSSPAPATPVKTVLANQAGRVVFNHRMHAEDYGVQCEQCHHENAAARPDPKPCASCHGQDIDETFVKTHQNSFAGDPQACLTCHHRELTPKWDKEMHERHAEMYTDSCQSCHHDSSIEPEPTSCSSCHETIEKGKALPEDPEPILFRDAVHQRCFSCHEPEKPTPTDDGCAFCHELVVTRDNFVQSGKKELIAEESALFPRCAACHYTQAVNELIPGRMPAYHKQCGDCHADMNAGPSVQDKQQCNQCHIR